MTRDHVEVRAHAQMVISRQARESSESLTTEDIRDAVIRTAEFLGARQVSVDSIVAELETLFATVIGRHQVLTSDDGWSPWLKARQPDIDWRFWDRYRQHLLYDQGWAPATLDKLDDTTASALGLLSDPLKPGSWNRRGMIVGEVQSGKTSHYIGLICKAADAGYKVVIVLAGFHKSLRSQTQIRLEEGFLGFDRTQGDSENSAGPVGVWHIDPSPKADSITTRADDGDFKRAVANHFGGIHPGGNPLLFVVKKNASVLKNLQRWVKSVAGGQGGVPLVRDIPLLVIDDEADQGSVDTRLQEFDEDGQPDPDHDPTAINRLIRSLLKLFDQHAYVGYTATPFANIFIHEQGETEAHGEDLFPKSFILSLPTPSNHVGPSTVFGYEAANGTVVEGLPMVRPVDDHADSEDLNERSGWMPPRHDKTHSPRYRGDEALPPSLRRAVHSFVLSTATRYARGQSNHHNTMLVHVTRFTAVQRKVAEQLRDEVTGLKRRLRYGEGSVEDGTMKALRTLWEEDFSPTTRVLAKKGLVTDEHVLSWEDIEPHLGTVSDSILVREINGYAGEVLDYKIHEGTGLNVIAVGGDKLSRGLTLEGLTTSFFLRASRMYDTLMQMGRWFGYRQGYVDLCRLYTTGEMESWFSHIAMASDELKEDFDRMVASGGTPRDFGHRVRSHPTLLVTSAVKMRHGHQIDVTFAGDISETINFRRDADTVRNNLEAAKTLLSSLRGQLGGSIDSRKGNSSQMWRNGDAEHVVAFLRQYCEHESSRRVKTKLLADYIEAELRAGRLNEWCVLVASGDGRHQELAQVALKLVVRSWHETATAKKENLRLQNHYRIRRLLNPSDEWADLSPEEYAMALSLTQQAWRENPVSRTNPDEERPYPEEPAGKFAREVRPETRGLLMIYPLDPGEGEERKVVEAAGSMPVIGFGISFPTVGDGEASKVRFTVGNVYYQTEVLGGTSL